MANFSRMQWKVNYCAKFSLYYDNQEFVMLKTYADTQKKEAVSLWKQPLV